jgi:hypothetical protein
VSDLFQAKILDLGIQFFQNQYQRFVEHCEKTCINRRLNLSDVSFLVMIILAKTRDEWGEKDCLNIVQELGQGQHC